MQMGAHAWRAALRRLQNLQLAAGERVSCRARRLTEQEIEQRLTFVETQHGTRLPRSYRAFLRELDGVENLFRGASLLSCDQLLDSVESRRADAALNELNTPIPSFVSPVRPKWRDENLIVIGMDERAEIVFVLDPASRRDDGEMDVIAWIAGLGVRMTSFVHMLTFLGDLLDPQDAVTSTADVTQPAEDIAAFMAA